MQEEGRVINMCYIRQTAPHRTTLHQMDHQWILMIAIAVLILLITLASVFCFNRTAASRTSSAQQEPFANAAVVADLIFVFKDGPDSKSFTPIWAKFTDDYRATLEAVGVAVHKIKDNDPDVKQYALKEYPAILLTAPNHGALKTTFKGHRTVDTLADFVHTAYPTFDKKNFRRS